MARPLLPARLDLESTSNRSQRQTLSGALPTGHKTLRSGTRLTQNLNRCVADHKQRLGTNLGSTWPSRVPESKSQVVPGPSGKADKVPPGCYWS